MCRAYLNLEALRGGGDVVSCDVEGRRLRRLLIQHLVRLSRQGILRHVGGVVRVDIGFAACYGCATLVARTRDAGEKLREK